MLVVLSGLNGIDSIGLLTVWVGVMPLLWQIWSESVFRQIRRNHR
jgi:hypothetical protein